MTALIIVLSIIAFLTVILSLSVSFHISYDGDFAVTFHYGPFGRKLYPAVKKPDKIKKAKRKKSGGQKEKPAEKQKKSGFFETVSTVIDIVKSAFSPVGFLLRKVRITSLDAVVVVATGDAAETARLYGEVSAAVYGAVVGLKNLMMIKVKNLFVGYDFNADENTYKVRFKVKLRLIYAVMAAFCMFIRLVKNMLGSPAGIPSESAREHA